MSKVTSKLQVTVPKAVADAYKIRPGSILRWMPAGGAIRVEVDGFRSAHELSPAERLAIFDEQPRRIEARIAKMKHRPRPGSFRPWTREEIWSERIGKQVR